MAQPELFPAPPALPPGFIYRADFLTAEEERALVARLQALPFKPFEFHGYLGHRRVVSFGWRYGFGDGGLQPTEALPDFLVRLRDRCADLAGVAPDAMPHAMITEYAPGAGIGWHRDRPEFGVVAGVSLVAPCRFRLRRRRPGGFDRTGLTLAPRSAYLLQGEVRTAWEHSIPGVEALRYSITFRTLKA